MLKRRLIPVVLMREGLCVQSKGFTRYQSLGNPFTIVGRLSSWASDELVWLDITREGSTYDLRRDDTNFPNRATLPEIIRDVADQALMPLTVGGRVRSVADVEVRLRAGADKVTLNTAPLRRPNLLAECSREFGAQCIVVSVDARTVDGRTTVCADGGREDTGRDVVDWCEEAVERGAGEVLLNSIDRDGRRTGYDLDLIRRVREAVTVPVVALGGVGSWDHLAEGLDAGASAVAAANIFHHSENSVHAAKRFLHEAGYDVRRPELIDEDI